MAPKTLASRATNQQADWEVLNDTCVLGFTSQDTLKRGLNDTKAAQRWRRVTLFETQNVLGVEVGEAWCNRVAVDDADLINSKFKGCWCLVFFGVFVWFLDRRSVKCSHIWITLEASSQVGPAAQLAWHFLSLAKRSVKYVGVVVVLRSWLNWSEV